MRYSLLTSLFLSSLFVICSIAFANDELTQPVTVTPPKGFKAIFNGKDLAGWHGMCHFDPYKLAEMSQEDKKKFLAAQTEDLKKHWRVENGELINDGKGAFATTNKDYKNFELLIEYKTVPLADSGIYLRATPQVQIWDTREEAGQWSNGSDKGSGALWNNQKTGTSKGKGKFPLVKADKPFGEWNSFRIVMQDDKVSVWLNGKQTVNNTPLDNYWRKGEPLIEKGPIQLQTHGGTICWRNIFIKELD